MAFVEGGNDGVLNGVNEVTLVAVPAASTRRLIRTITVHNSDTADVTLSIRLKETASLRILWSGLLRVGDTLFLTDVIVLDTVNKSVTALMSGAAATSNPDFTSSWGDAT